MKIVRVVLDQCVTEADVDSAGWDLQWYLSEVIKAEGTTPKQAIFYEENENGEITFIKYTEDFHIDLPYIEIYSKSPSSIETVVEDIRKKLPTHTISEIVEMIENAKDREELFLAIRYLGIGCGGHPMTPELLELFEKLANDRDREIRDVTRLAMAYTAAAEFEPILEHMAQNDPEPELREQAAHTLESIRKFIINQPVS